MKLWRDYKTKVLLLKKGWLIACWICPCCRPKVIASKITNPSSPRWDLTPYQGEHIGLPGARWRIRDVGESHWNNRDNGCSGSIYNNGSIDGDGVLTGLPNEFVSGYSYNGYMQLQMGCVDENGNITWPCPGGG